MFHCNDKSTMQMFSGIPSLENLMLLSPKGLDIYLPRSRPPSLHTFLFSFMPSIINQHNAKNLEG